MTFKIRKVSRYNTVIVDMGNGTTHDLGMLDDDESKALADELRKAADEIHKDDVRVYFVNDHGNVDLLVLKKKIVKGKVIKVDSDIVKSWV